MAEADIDLFFKPSAGRFLPCKTKSDESDPEIAGSG
jgi:hypothetical protein